MSDFDPAKNVKNIGKHHISLERWVEMTYLAVFKDDRNDYGEHRFLAYGTIDGQNHCFVFTVRDGKTRPISLRRAHAKEMRRYVPQN